MTPGRFECSALLHLGVLSTGKAALVEGMIS